MKGSNNFLALKNKTYLVTGVTSGIGKDICLTLLKEGAKVIGIARDETKIKEIIDVYSPTFFRFYSFDLEEINEIESLINKSVETFGKLDGCILCAGKEETVPLSVYKPEKLLHLFNINVFSGIEILRLFSKKKNSNDASSVIFFSSVMAELGQPGKVGYCASKAAITGVVKASALELAKRKIRVNAILPGVIDTPMTNKLFGNLNDENINEIIKKHPLGIGKAEDVTSMAMFLLSNKSSWLTGQNIKIDGGYSIS